jgi:hypothetical protein
MSSVGARASSMIPKNNGEARRSGMVDARMRQRV